MKAAVLVELNKPLLLADIDLTELSTGQVLVKVLVSGICGSQLHDINGNKGNRKFFTMGAGFKTNALNVDLSYLINSSDVNNPLENSLRFSLSFDLGEIYDDY